MFILQALDQRRNDIWTKSDLESLFDCMTIYGYGNWEKIAKEFNQINFDKYVETINPCVIRTPEGITLICTQLILFYTV